MKSLALLLLGAWIAGTSIMAFVATQNFRTVDRILAAPTPQAVSALSSVPHATLRPLLRHLASELNRFYFVAWGWAQLALGLGVMILLLASQRKIDAAMAAVLGAITIAQLTLWTPSIIEIGRRLDFVPRDPLPPDAAPVLAHFWRLHGLYTGSDLLSLGIGLVLAWRLVRNAS